MARASFPESVKGFTLGCLYLFTARRPDTRCGHHSQPLATVWVAIPRSKLQHEGLPLRSRRLHATTATLESLTWVTWSTWDMGLCVVKVVPAGTGACAIKATLESVTWAT